MRKQGNINDYVEHIVKCPKCNQKYSDKFSNYAPDKEGVCTLCEYSGFEGCCHNKDKSLYEYKDEIDCKNCFFNGEKFDPRMSAEENENHLNILKDFYERNK